MIRALPLTYHGVTFRSALEADWAANLDAYVIAWSYEPLAVDLGNGVRYLADFYLPGQNVWLEVKGPHDLRIAKTRGFASALSPDMWDHRTPLVVVGRPAERERLCFHGALPGSDIRLAECRHCERFVFADHNGTWVCRFCGHWQRPIDWHESGTLQFHRAPRPGRAA